MTSENFSDNNSFWDAFIEEQGGLQAFIDSHLDRHEISDEFVTFLLQKFSGTSGGKELERELKSKTGISVFGLYFAFTRMLDFPRGASISKENTAIVDLDGILGDYDGELKCFMDKNAIRSLVITNATFNITPPYTSIPYEWIVKMYSVYYGETPEAQVCFSFMVSAQNIGGIRILPHPLPFEFFSGPITPDSNVIELNQMAKCLVIATPDDCIFY